MKFLACIISFATLSLTQAIAQCNVHKKTDEFTNASSLWTDKISITKGGGHTMLKKFNDDCRYKIYMKYIAKNGKIYLTMSEDADYCFCTITAVMFKLSNGKTIIKQNLTQGLDGKTTLGSEQYSFTEISKEELTELASNAVMKVRIVSAGCTDHPILEEELEDKAANTIKEDSGCLIKNLAN